MSEVVVVIGPGSIGQAIARRVAAGKHVVLADLRQANADAAAEVMRNAGFDVSTTTVDVASRESVALVETATSHGDITRLVHAAGVSPSQAPVQAILAVDLFGTAVVLEEFGNVIAQGGAGVVITSQSGHRLGALTPEQNAALATTPANELLALPFLQPDEVTDTLHAYQLAKRGNALRVMAAAVRWAERGARVNTISPGIIITPARRGRAHRTPRRELPAHARPKPRGSRRHPRRSRHRRCTPPRLRRRMDHRQRLPHGRRRHRLLLLRRARPAMTAIQTGRERHERTSNHRHPQQRRRDTGPRPRCLPDPCRRDPRAVAAALDTGYRLIDTAAAYGNERQVGEAVRDSALARSEVFLETKIWISDYGYDETLHGFDKSARKLGVDQIDLLILHQALPSAFDRTLDAYRALEHLLADGKVRAIGVSNFMVEHLHVAARAGRPSCPP